MFSKTISTNLNVIKYFCERGSCQIKGSNCGLNEASLQHFSKVAKKCEH